MRLPTGAHLTAVCVADAAAYGCSPDIVGLHLFDGAVDHDQALAWSAPRACIEPIRVIRVRLVVPVLPALPAVCARVCVCVCVSE